jgi:hypothetical protein
MSHQKQSRAVRLQLITTALKIKPMRLSDLGELYGTFSNERSKRQIQRDLKEIAILVSEATPLLSFFKAKEKFYYLDAEANTPPIADLALLPEVRIRNTCYSYPLSLELTTQKLALLQDAIAKQYTVAATQVKNDETGDNFDFESNELALIPIEILYHRNDYYLGSFSTTKKEIVFYNLKQLDQISIKTKKRNTKNYAKLLHSELQKRFGITKNINNEVYGIKIEVAKVLAEFLRNHQWHDSQKMVQEKNKFFLYLYCGINRELVGWLFQWMYNIKIIEPPILKKYYENTLKKIQKIHQNEAPRVYRNMFEFKEK